jgi:hypothetical protein
MSTTLLPTELLIELRDTATGTSDGKLALHVLFAQELEPDTDVGHVSIVLIELLEVLMKKANDLSTEIRNTSHSASVRVCTNELAGYASLISQISGVLAERAARESESAESSQPEGVQ